MTTQYYNPRDTESSDRTFFSMTAAYSLGVFNDNFFKQAAMLLAIGAGLTHLQGTATVVFALPFILFSAYAGWLADRYPKKNVVVNSKILELVAMLIGAAGVLTANWACILAMVSLMGLQSAIFGPALNGFIPEHFTHGNLPRINGVLKMVTTVAILIGIAGAGLLLDIDSGSGPAPSGSMLIACTVVVISVLGLTASLGIKKYRAAAPHKPFPWAGPLHSFRHFWLLRRDPQLMLAVVSDAFFYFLATLVLLIINTLGLQQLGLSQAITSLLSVALMIGVAGGSVFAARVATVENWRNILRPGTCGMGCGLLAAASAPLMPEQTGVVLLMASLVLTGFCGGMFLIPITSFIQVRPAESDKGQVLAVTGFCSFVGILAAGQAYCLLDGLFRPNAMLVCTAVVSLAGTAAYTMFFKQIHKSFPRRLLHRIVRHALRLRYSIRVEGLEKLTTENDGGSILFLPNHPALIDPVILVSLLYESYQPRPLADRDHTDKWYIRPIMRLVNAVRIPNLMINGRKSREEVAASIDAVIRSLRQGDNILLYPAGRLYRSRYEQLGAKSAVETILREIPEQKIVLVRTTGLWGSSFSWADGRPLPLKEWKRYVFFSLANLFFFGPRRKVTVEFREPENFPRTADRLVVNRFLEEFYNGRTEPNTYVPYFWWQGSKPEHKPDPEQKTAVRGQVEVPPAVREIIAGQLRKMTGAEHIGDHDNLARDMGLDSLTIMELAVWMEQEFGMPVDDLQSMQTVGDLMLAACGQNGGGQGDRISRVPEKWFRGNRDRKLQLQDTADIARAFLHRAALSPENAVVADRISGVKTYRQLIMAIMIMKEKLQRIDADNVGIMLPAAVSASVCYFAALFAGKVPVMLNWTVGPGQMQHCIKTAGVTHIVTAEALMDKLTGQGVDLRALQVQWVYLEQLRKEITPAEKIRALVKSHTSWSSLRNSRVRETAAILFTSGSETQPKAVPLTHGNILANLKDFNSVLSFREGDRLLGMLPPFHSLGLAGTIIMPLCLGLKTTYHANPTEGRVLARLIGQYRSTLLIGTPTFVNGIIRSATPGQLASLRLLFTGAEKCPEYVYEAVARVLPQAVLCEGYGITECSPVVSVNTPDNPQPGTIGRVLPGMEYLIVDPDSGEPVAAGEQGLLLVRGANVFTGYLGRGNQSPFISIKGRQWYNTGDLVREDTHRVLSFCGRIKRFIKLGGEMISLPAIESVLQQHFPPAADGTPSLAVEATPDENHPEVVLFTTFRIDRQEVNSCIRRAGLSALHNIRRLVEVKSIPVLGTGKIDYRQLKTALA